MKDFIKEILEKDKEIIVKYVEFPEEPPVYSDFKFKNQEVNELLDKLGFKLYLHQVQALEALYNGKNVILTTPTASGKSEVFRLYILDLYLSDKRNTFLLIYPTRALLYDQYEKLKERYSLVRDSPKIGILLGDLTSWEKQEIIKQKPNVILTTPDTLHLFILKNHQDFSWFFKNLRLIVIDELHTYKGVFGTNAAYLFRRLFRLLDYYYKNRNYQIICLSATLKNPIAFAEKLLGKDNFVLIDKSFHKKPKRYLLILDPSEKYSNPFIYLKNLTLDLIKHNIKSLIFVETKRQTEKLKLMFFDTNLLNLIEVYKGSLTRKTRKEIERKFKDNELLILFTTSALELGIDIGDVQCVVNFGVPPDGLFSLIQRFGRTARIKEGLNILVLREDALDAYYKENVDELIERIRKNLIEEIPVNLENPFVVKKHLLYLINEFRALPLNILTDYEKKILEELKKEGYVGIRKNWFTNEEYAYLKRNISYSGIRNIGEETYYIIKYSEKIKRRILEKNEKDLYRYIQFLKIKGIILEETDKKIFYEQLLPGMIYFSLGRLYRVKEHLLLGKVNFVFVEELRTKEPLETKPLYKEDVHILEIYDEKKVFGIPVYLAKLRIRRIYEGYILKKITSEKDEYNYIGEFHIYDNPYIYEFETKGIFLVLDENLKEIEEEEYNMFMKKLDKYLKKHKLEKLKDLILMFVNSIDKEELYNKYRGGTTKRIIRMIENFLSRFGLDVNKHKKLIFYIKKLIDSYYGFQSGLHAIEHNIIKISPVVTNVDSRELGGYSYERYKTLSESSEVSKQFLDKPVIFIYEGYEGGVGLAEILFENIEKLLIKSRESLFKCKCLDGCPRCILSPKCGNANEFLDKYAGRLIYKRLFGNIKNGAVG